jgi:hypothetical protein
VREKTPSHLKEFGIGELSHIIIFKGDSENPIFLNLFKVLEIFQDKRLLERGMGQSPISNNYE